MFKTPHDSACASRREEQWRLLEEKHTKFQDLIKLEEERRELRDKLISSGGKPSEVRPSLEASLFIATDLSRTGPDMVNKLRQGYEDALVNYRMSFAFNELHVNTLRKSAAIVDGIIDEIIDKSARVLVIKQAERENIKFQSSNFLEDEKYWVNEFNRKASELQAVSAVWEVLNEVVKEEVESVVQECFEYFEDHQRIIDRVIAGACVLACKADGELSFATAQEHKEFRFILDRLSVNRPHAESAQFERSNGEAIISDNEIADVQREIPKISAKSKGFFGRFFRAKSDLEYEVN